MSSPAASDATHSPVWRVRQLSPSPLTFQASAHSLRVCFSYIYALPFRNDNKMLRPQQQASTGGNSFRLWHFETITWIWKYVGAVNVRNRPLKTGKPSGMCLKLHHLELYISHNTLLTNHFSSNCWLKHILGLKGLLGVSGPDKTITTWTQAAGTAAQIIGISRNSLCKQILPSVSEM